MADRAASAGSVPYDPMKAIYLPIARTVSGVHAPLRRSLPAGVTHVGAARAHRTSVLLALAGVALFVDIEFGLAYLLYIAAGLIG